MTGTDRTNIEPPPPLGFADGLRRSYVIRHWRGQLPLPVSFWLNSVSLTLLVAPVAVLALIFSAGADGLLSWALPILGVWIFATAMSIWQLVGVWRSAGNDDRRARFWGSVARIAVVFGCLGVAVVLTKIAVPQLIMVVRVVGKENGLGAHSLKILRNGTELEFSGGITFGATNEIRKILDTAPSIKVLHLNSRGGQTVEARKLSELIKERKLITYTATVCASACTDAFLAGTERYAAPTARIGFHQAESSAATPQLLAEVNDKERRSLIEAGVPAWFADRAYSTPSSSMWWPSLQVLKEANVITAVARSDDFAVSGLPSEIDSDKVEAELLRGNPTLAAIKRFDPKAYSNIHSTIIESLKLGKSSYELDVMVVPLIKQMTKKYIPLASDAAIAEITQVLIAEIDAVGAKDEEACYRFINPRPGAAPVSVVDYASDELKKRELAAVAAVIETGAGKPQSVATEAEVSESLTAVIGNLSGKYSGSEVEMLSDFNSATADHKKLCRIYSAFLGEVMALPEWDRAALLRFIFAQ